MMSFDEAEVMRQARVGIILSVIFFTLSPYKYKFWPEIFGVELWRQGTSEHVFQTLNFIGLSQSISSARVKVDIFCVGFDNEIQLWKKTIQVHPCKR